MLVLDSVPSVQEDPCISHGKEKVDDSSVVYHRVRLAVLMGVGLAGGTSLTTTQSGPYGCWVSWATSLSTTQSGPYGCWVSWETSLSTTQSGPYGWWVSWATSLSTTQSEGYVFNMFNDIVKMFYKPY